MSTKTQPVNIRTTVNTIIEARERWFKDNDAEKIRRLVQSTIDKNILNIIQQVLGFERQYAVGNWAWKIDHCNGRSSSVTKLIQDEAITHLKAKLSEDTLRLSQKEEDQMKEAAHKEYMSMYRRKLMEFAKARAESDAQQLAKNLVGVMSDTDTELMKLMISEATNTKQ